MSNRNLPTRIPLTDEQLEALTVDESIRLKLTNDEVHRLKAINSRRMQERAAREVRLREEQRVILEELRKVGVVEESIWGLVNDPGPYPEAIPILLRHLKLPYSDATRDGIARCLAVPEPAVRAAWPMLVAEYRNAPTGRGFIAPCETKEYALCAKEGLALAVRSAVTEQTLPEFISLVKDRSNGESRVLLLKVLRSRRKKDPEVAQLLTELAEDPDLKKEIASWK
ncbi:hypothetical protein [Lysobacter antibioticus]|uniref:hypothetical protein n=1 Tax=Lysobacter antibioticus TaxID=84531 RepID=UPI000B045DAC|nr:hypothetical protein [Lysobacter antibioticus]